MAVNKKEHSVYKSTYIMIRMLQEVYLKVNRNVGTQKVIFKLQ